MSSAFLSDRTTSKPTPGDSYTALVASIDKNYTLAGTAAAHELDLLFCKRLVTLSKAGVLPSTGALLGVGAGALLSRLGTQLSRLG